MANYTGNDGPNEFHGTSDNDRFELYHGNDIAYGYGGRDYFRGGGGKDLLDGGPGEDTVSYSDKTGNIVVTLNGDQWVTVYGGGVAEDTIRSIESISGGAGNDLLTGDSLNNFFFGGDGHDTLTGGDGRDDLYGARGDDRLNGQNGDDYLYGGEGNDTLIGGNGRDIMQGGHWGDVFMYYNVVEAQGDTIEDFNMGSQSTFNRLERDKIDLSRIDADATMSGNQEFMFIGTGQFTGASRELRFQYSYLEGDVNGDRVSDFWIHIPGVQDGQLASVDFLL